MKLNRSINEQQSIIQKQYSQKQTAISSPTKMKANNMHKASSFKQNNSKSDLSTVINIKFKHPADLTEILSKSIRRPSTNRIDTITKDLIQKKAKVKIRRRWWDGKGGWSGEVPSTKVKIVMPPSDHLNDHAVNLAIKNINKFINHAFKMKGKEDYDMPTIISWGKILGIIYSRTQIVDHNFLRSREFLSFSKEKILKYLYSAINKSNGNIEPDNSKSVNQFRQYRFYVAKGNNGILVRSVIKQRWWWSMNSKENFHTANFVWTQWRKNIHLCILETK
jgi:hypothetical protein